MTTTIDIRTDLSSCGLRARKIWEALFRSIPTHGFHSFDSFLCDLSTFERLLKEGKNTFYWICSDSGYTDVCLDDDDTVYDKDSDKVTCFKIVVEYPSITVKRVW